MTIALTVLPLLAAASIVAAGPSGAELFAHGDFAAAKTAFANEAAREPKNAAALLGLARVELYDNDLDSATRDAKAALALDPADEAATRVLEIARERQAVAASATGLDVPPQGVVVPFLESEPPPAVQLTIDGKPGTFVVDTGAPDVTLDPAFAASLGLAVTDAGQGTFLGGRTAQVKRAVVERVGIGPLEIRHVSAAILPSRGFRVYADRTVDGFVGTIFLSRFLATIDYPHRRLVLLPRNAEASSSPPSTTVPMWLVGDHFVFARGSVNGAADLLFSIDSGATGVGFMPVAQTISAAHIKTFPDKKQQGMGGGGPASLVPVLSDEVCVGTACQRDVPGSYTPEGSPLTMFPFAVAGTVSHVFLERYAVTFDFVRMRMTLAAP